MSESTLTSKGQTTVPLEVRKRLQAEPGARLSWTITSTGAVLIRVKSRSVLELAGSIKPGHSRHVPDEKLGLP